MQKSILSFATLLLLGVGCLNAPTGLVDDFEPVRGRATTPGDRVDGPFEHRLMTAISYDGLSYTQNDTWVADQADSPDAVVKDGTIYLYYTGWIVGDRINTTAVALSRDGGRTWVYKHLELTDAGPIDRVVYPDVVLLEDGTFRLFFTAGNPQGIHYAESVDGITFAYKGVVFAQSDDIAIDSTTFKVGDTWHMYAASKDGTKRLWHLTSTDGSGFTVYAMTSFPFENEPRMPGNGYWLEDRYHLYLSSTDDVSIRSTWSKKGFDWYPGEGVRLEPLETEAWVRDPAIVALENGQYLMFYVTKIP
ncbi:exo-alpha-sialidase [Candidatus Uhrbacteria bacterium]|nr:exo-alpha-sialidase [Candidatus Uhrbacteria bacterium]